MKFLLVFLAFLLSQSPVVNAGNHEVILAQTNKAQLESSEDPQKLAPKYYKIARKFQSKGKYQDAYLYFKKTLEALRKFVPEKHRTISAAYDNMAVNLNKLGKYTEAQPLYIKALQIRKETLPEGHSDIATSYNNVALNLYRLARYKEAESLFNKALEIRKKLSPKGNPRTASLLTTWLSILIAKRNIKRQRNYTLKL